MARIVELEQSAKESAENTKLRDAEINELRSRVSKLEQKDSQNDSLREDIYEVGCSASIASKETSIPTETKNSNDVSSEVISQSKDVPASDNTSNSDEPAPNPDVSSNASNFYVYQDMKTQPEAKSPEDANASKVIDEFLDEVYKESVSDSIRQRKHEEKLQDQNPDLSSVNHDVSLATSESCDTKTVPSDSSRKTIYSGNDQTEISELEQDD
ncbi:1312_t:CDS:1, partial [Acaulospora morrowiae]